MVLTKMIQVLGVDIISTWKMHVPLHDPSNVGWEICMRGGEKQVAQYMVCLKQAAAWQSKPSIYRCGSTLLGAGKSRQIYICDDNVSDCSSSKE